MDQVARPRTTDGKSSPDQGLRQRVWPSVLTAVAGLIYLVWAGSGADPRQAELWKFVRPSSMLPPGWFEPAAGLGHVWISGILVISALSVMRFRLRNGLAGVTSSLLAESAVIGIILVVALDVRLAVLRMWAPLALDEAVIGARTFRAVAAGGRGWAIVADMLTVGVLLLALRAKGRSYWLAALYGFHPVVIMQVAGNGSPIVWWMPVVVLAAMGWRFQRWLRELIVMGAAAGCTWWVAHLGLTQAPFDGWLAECLGSLGWEERSVAGALIAVEMALQALVMVVAARQGWNLARTLGHVLVAWAVVSPRVMPADVLPILVLLPLAWTRAGWVVGGTILALYAIVPWNLGHQPLRVPGWVTFVVMAPVAVTAAEEWVMGVAQDERVVKWLGGRVVKWLSVK